ncbi:acetyltransferase [Thecamonas trahens ATCC 50062]|uniref:Acetyltransferase n=1 Tax=Thecamonas trahens ATCC 50062 TaxID=461836 RepID=A0A0L0DNN2_THETB|nr:acetyltransferase [Thecamonas trahens ATCC 50062]KNC53028.1 acetyltransferase [Thecamonas trahens ATCC 50062]|eukprot:XP_013754706.1 acetyltransferase [Thecamonas trahens ATCC 50062]
MRRAAAPSSASVTIRAYNPETDALAIHALLTDAFDTPAEADLMAAVLADAVSDDDDNNDQRTGTNYSLQCYAAVATSATDTVIGTVLFSPVTITAADGSVVAVAWGLGPIAVAESARGCGVGQRLAFAWKDAPDAAGVPAIVVLGARAYYHDKLGYDTAPDWGLRFSSVELDEHFFILPLDADALAAAGLVRGASPAGSFAASYHPAFDAV